MPRLANPRFAPIAILSRINLAGSSLSRVRARAAESTLATFARSEMLPVTANIRKHSTVWGHPSAIALRGSMEKGARCQPQQREHAAEQQRLQGPFRHGRRHRRARDEHS